MASEQRSRREWFGGSCALRPLVINVDDQLCIFRTSNNRGWGVKTLQRIPKGSFVMEYIGQIITEEEAERRGRKYDAQAMTYLFDLDFNDGDCPFSIDAKMMGNISHFVNHSCEPNLDVYGVWVEHLDPRIPRIALFAKKDIAKDEELTFDYRMTVAKYPDDIIPGEVDARQTPAENRVEPPADSESELDDDVTDANNANMAVDQVVAPVEGITEIPKTPEKKDIVVPEKEAVNEVVSTVLPDTVVPPPDVSESSPAKRDHQDHSHDSDTTHSGIKNADEQQASTSSDRVNLPDVVPDMTAFPTPTPSDHDSDVMIERDLVDSLKRSQNMFGRKKSPTKRRNNTAFKCVCGSKKCRGYFYSN